MSERPTFAKYPKIPGPFKRYTEGEKKNQLHYDNWTEPEIEVLSGAKWDWTEKIDGTNIRVLWDGYRVESGGRTDNAVIPGPLQDHLTSAFPEEILEQTFGSKAVVLYGEGYGGKIQKMSDLYGEEQKFIPFDVLSTGEDRDFWAQRDAVQGIAHSLGVSVVPEVLTVETLYDAIGAVSRGLRSALDTKEGSPKYAEGLVGTAPLGILDRRGNRIQVKVKHVDFYQPIFVSDLNNYR